MKKKPLMKFLNPSKFEALFGIAAIALGLILILLVNDQSAHYLGIFFLVLGAIITILDLSLFKDRKQYDGDLKDSGLLKFMEEDYEKAVPAFKGNLYLGEQWMFGKKSTRPVAYSEITRLYEYVHKTNGSEGQRTLQVLLTDGSGVSVCKLPLRGKGDEELKRVIALILEKNPNVQLGYQG